MPAFFVNYGNRVSQPSCSKIDRRELCTTRQKKSYRIRIIREKVHSRCLLRFQIVFPSLHRKLIVDRNHIDTIHTLLDKLLGHVDKTRDLRGACRREGAWDADDYIFGCPVVLEPDI